MKKAFPFSFYLLFYAALASLMPFLVLYYQQLGLSGAQIGALTGVSQIIALFGGPFLASVADATRCHSRVMSLALAMLVVIGAVFPLLKTLPAVALIAILLAFFTAPIVPLSDSAVLAMLGTEKEKYGRISLGGTIGWGLAAPIAGILVEDHGLQLAFWSYSILVFLALLVSQTYVFPATTEGSSLRVGIRHLVSSPNWRAFLFMAFACGAGFAAVNDYFFAYLKELNASEGLMGLALTIATVAELPVLFFANRLLRKLGTRRLLKLTMGITVIRLLLYGVLGSPVAVLVFQVMNGLTMPLFWVAGVAYADENASSDMKSSAQSLFGALVSGIGAAAGGLFGGFLLDLTTGRGMYLAIGIMLFLSLIWVSLYERKLGQ